MESNQISLDPYELIHSLRQMQLQTISEQYHDKIQEDLDQYQGVIKMLIRGTPAGEKLITIEISNQWIIYIQDLIFDLISFFRGPFIMGNDQPFLLQPIFNNYPPMVLKIDAKNLSIVLLSDYQNYLEKSLVVATTARFEQTFLADCQLGPGIMKQNLEVRLLEMYLYPTCLIVPARQEQQNIQILHSQQNLDPSKMNFPVKNNSSQVVQYHHDTLFKEFVILLGITYSIAFCREDSMKERQKHLKNENKRQYTFYEMGLQLLDPLNNSQQHNEISISIKNIKFLQKIIAVMTQPSQEELQLKNILKFKEINKAIENENNNQDNSNGPYDDCICITSFQIDHLKLNLLKYNDLTLMTVALEDIHFKKLLKPGIKLKKKKQLEMSDENGGELPANLLNSIELDDRNKIEWNQLLNTQCTVTFNYFNKRNMALEPVLEPFTFYINFQNIYGKSTLIIDNQNEEQENKKNKAGYIDKFENALNLNVTSQFLGIVLDAQQIYETNNDEQESTTYINYSGYYLQITNAKSDKENFNKQEEKAGEKFQERNSARKMQHITCLLYTSPSPRDRQKSRMPSSA
eukprot:TRINITY_DN12465_c0_g1_i1.p1 TRINITY_DN12465_c0_g1~~TRINITY_DN12465_c0_g1_i1.p1  ORF type:complete len:575 (+),score=97.77 TRINITY_DN12465_c0_g1_i1:264-1988(+)